LSPSPDLPGQPSKPVDLVGIAARRAVAAIICGLLLFACLSPLAFVFRSAYYSTSGIMQVTRVLPSILNTSEVYSIGSYYGSYVQTQLVFFRKDDVLKDALTRLPPEMKGRFTVGSLKSNLALKPIMGTELFEVTLTDRRPDGLAVMVNAIIEAYLAKSEQEQEFNSNRRLGYLRTEKEGMDKNLADAQKDLNEISQKLQSSSFDEMYNPYRQSFRLTQETLARAKADRLQKEHMYQEIQKRNEELRKLPMDAVAFQLAYSDQSLWGIQFWTYQTVQGMRATIDGIATGNPDRQYVEARMKSMQEFETAHRDGIMARTKQTVVEKRDYDLEKDRISAEHECLAAVNTEKRLEEEIVRLGSLAALQSADLLRGEALKSRIENLQHKIFQIEERIFDLSMEAKQPLRVFPANLAVQPYAPAQSNFPKLLLMLFIFSMGACGGVFALYDLADPRIRRAKDVEFAIGSLPHRPIPYLVCGEPGAPASFERLLLETPNSFAALSVRSLAVRLHLEHETRGTRLVLGTGIDGRNGVTALLLNAAQAMTGLCQRVLLVDINRQGSGTLRHRLGLAADPRSLAKEIASPGSGIIRDAERGIDLLLAAPDEAFRLQDLLNSLTDLQQRYDMILVDAPPLLFSPETECLVKAAPLSLLVIEADYSIYADVRRALALLFRFNAPAVMAVLNWGGHGPEWCYRIPLFPPWPLVKRPRPKPPPPRLLALANTILIGGIHLLDRCLHWRRPAKKSAA
jgi:Mrp family chromosome partitioning ATPase